MKKILTILLLMSLILSSCWTTPVVTVEKPTAKNVKTSVAKMDYFTEETRLIGRISTLSETSINPLTSWIVNKINIEVGQRVKAWQVLATLDLSNTSYGVSYNNAQTSLNNSINSYNLTEESIRKDLESAGLQLDNAKLAKENTYSATDKQLELAQTQLNNIVNNKNNLIATTWESLKNAELSLVNAKTSIENFKKNSLIQMQSLRDQEKSLYDNTKIAIDNSYISFDSTLTQFDNILWFTDKNKHGNDAYEIYLGAKYSDSKIQSERIYWEAASLYNKYHGQINYKSYDTILASLDNSIILADKFSSLCDSMVIMINNTITAANFPQTQLDWLGAIVLAKQSTITWIKSNLIALKNSIKDSDNRITTAQTNIDTTNTTLQNALNIAESQLSNIKAGNTSQLDNIAWNEELTKVQLENTIITIKQARDNIDNSLRIAQSNYDSTKAKLNNQRVASKSQIDNAKWWKELAWIQLNNTSIVAPFDGIILSKNIEIWSNISPQTPAFTIWDNNKFKVKLDVNSDNITYFHINDSINLKDISWKSFSWIISNKTPSPDQTTKLYKVEILINGNTDKINIWDYIDVYLEKKSWDKKLISIPLSSFISFWEWKYGIYIVNDKNIVKLSYITLWKKNNTNVEVLSWLKEWDRFVKEWVLNLDEWDEIKDIQ